MRELIVTMGIPGSGKSTIAAKTPTKHVICPDNIREMLFGDPTHQDNNDLVFAHAHSRLKTILNDGESVLFDATNVQAFARKELLDIAAQYPGTWKVLLVVDVPLAVAKERNAKRDRVVPEDVLDRMHARFMQSLSQIGFEQWDAIRFVRFDESK